MSSKINQREAIRLQKSAQKRKNILRIGIIFISTIFILSMIYFLPQVLSETNQEYQKQDGLSLGDPDAPVKVEEFSNFGCSHCKNFSENLEPDFIEKYVDTGKVYFTFYPFQFDNDPTLNAGMAAYCAADQNSFWQYKQLLFENAAYPGGFVESSLINYAKKIGMDQITFEDCLKNNTHAEDLERIRDYASSLGVTGTPMFNVNGNVVYSNTLEATVEAALAGL